MNECLCFLWKVLELGTGIAALWIAGIVALVAAGVWLEGHWIGGASLGVFAVLMGLGGGVTIRDGFGECKERS